MSAYKARDLMVTPDVLIFSSRSLHELCSKSILNLVLFAVEIWRYLKELFLNERALEPLYKYGDLIVR